MNRRSFFNTILKAGAGCMILPAATTYTRHWSGLLVPKSPALGIELWTTQIFLWRDGHWEERDGANLLEWQATSPCAPGQQFLTMQVKYD